MEIIVHRAISASKGNTIEGVKQNIQHGFGIEIDLRMKENIIYLAHDKIDSTEFFEDMCRILQKSQNKFALHVKEYGLVPQIIKLCKKYVLQNVFVFSTDNENLSKYMKEIQIALYVNSNPENVKEKILWCDETQEKWFNEKTILKLHQENKKLYAMSKELIKKSTKKEIYQEWERLKNLEIDGICTEYPYELLSFLNRGKNH